MFVDRWQKPKIIQILLENNKPNDLAEFSKYFEINVRSDVNRVLTNYKIYLTDDLFARMLNK